ncbi:MAG: MarR family winged helix-turn-helix transcriptional regulator [Cellulosilyticaceae bacterium]
MDGSQEKETIGSYIGHFYRLGTTFLSKEYKGYHIGTGQYQFLMSLYREDGVCHDVLTEKLGVDKATTTRAIMKLEEEGYVTRQLNEKDKRKYYIYLTEKAIAKKEEILAIALKWEEKLIGHLTKEECAEFVRLFKKIKLD